MSRWSPLALVDAREDIVRFHRRGARELRRLTDPEEVAAADETAAADGYESRRRLADELDADADGYAACELSWVTPDMTRVAVQAASGMPDWAPLHEMPWPRGLLVWEQPLPPLLWQQQRNALPHEATALDSTPVQVPVHGITWGPTDAGGVQVVLLSRQGTGPAAFGYSLLSTRMHLLDMPLFPFGAVTLPGDTARGASASIGLRPNGHHVIEQVVDVVGSTWHTMMLPTLAERSERWVDPDRNQAGRPPRKVPGVTVVTLRRLRERGVPRETDPAAPPRTYSCRWMVRGHFRQQPYGPGRSLRRLQLIEPYVAGPADKPLRVTDHVYAWRR